MRALSLAVLTTLGLASIANCAAPTDAEATSTAEGASTPLVRGGFMTLGGYAGTCLAPKGDRPFGGDTLVSEACTNAPYLAHGWIVRGMWGRQTISPQMDPTLCIDIDVVRSNAFLARCSGSSSQWFALELGQIQAFIGDFCLDVTGGSPASGTRVGVVQCNGSPAQAFWSFGIPIAIGAAMNEGECITSNGSGQQLTTGACGSAIFSSSSSAIPASAAFYGTLDHRLLQRGDGDQCLTVPAFTNGSYGPATISPCTYPVPPGQQWGLDLVSHPGQSWGNYAATLHSYAFPRFRTGAECLDVPGDLIAPGAPVDVNACAGDSWAQVLMLPMFEN